MISDNTPITALEVAQQIINQFDPGHTVVSWKIVEGCANVVELEFTDGTHRKLVGLFAHHILSAHYTYQQATWPCICGADDNSSPKLPRFAVFCPKHDR